MHWLLREVERHLLSPVLTVLCVVFPKRSNRLHTGQLVLRVFSPVGVCSDVYFPSSVCPERCLANIYPYLCMPNLLFLMRQRLLLREVLSYGRFQWRTNSPDCQWIVWTRVASDGGHKAWLRLWFLLNLRQSVSSFDSGSWWFHRHVFGWIGPIMLLLWLLRFAVRFPRRIHR